MEEFNLCSVSIIASQLAFHKARAAIVMGYNATKWAVDQLCGSAPAKNVLLILARYADDDNGQCYPSIKRVSRESELSVRTVQRSLDALEVKNLIIRDRSLGGKGHSNRYQLNLKGCQRDTVKPCQSDTLPDSNHVTQSTKGVRESSKGCQSDLLIISNNQINNKVPNSNSKNVSNGSVRFDEFYKAYPRHQKKAQAKTIWIQKDLDAKADEIIKHVNERVKNDPSWSKDNGQYIPLPDTFLRNERWEDEYQITVCTQPGAITKSLEPEEDEE